MSKVLDLVLAGTTSQFDADSSLATTEFVQRALGNTRSFVSITESITLTAADSGRCYALGGVTASSTITLPLVSSCPTGVKFEFLNVGTNVLTITRQGSDLIYPQGNGVTSFALGVGDSLVVESSGTSWVAVGGSVQLGYAAKFGASLGKPGYQKLPSGLVMVWGTTPASSASAAVATTYPLALTSVFSAHISAGNSAAAHFARFDTNPSGTGFTSSVWNTSGARVADCESFYLIIGKV